MNFDPNEDWKNSWCPRKLRSIFWAIVLGLLLLLLLSFCGCSFKFLYRGDIAQTLESFQVYREYTQPVSDPEKVEKLGDLIEKTLRDWKGDYVRKETE